MVNVINLEDLKIIKIITCEFHLKKKVYEPLFFFSFYYVKYV